MNDQISRQKLIEELESLDKYFVEALPLNSETVFIAGEVRELIESQPPADQWIPCSEKNPSKPGYYEVTVKDGMGCRIRTMARYDITIKDWVTSTIHDDEVVVAWREPLPEPYKGE